MINYDAFLSRAAERMKESAIRKMGTVLAQSRDIISFAPGYPAPDTFAWKEYQDISRELLSGGDGNVLQYGPTRGYRPLLEAIGGVMQARGIPTTVERLLVTTGSQQGLDLIARVLLDPGDIVLVELPTYTGAITAFRNVLSQMVGVRQQSDGIDLAALDDTYTGLVRAGRRNVLIVEDDPYRELYFESVSETDLRSIKADDTEGRVVYLSSFSKTLAPGFRVAWIDAPAALASKFEMAKQAEDLCTGALDQRMVFEAMRRGVLQRQIPVLRAHYQQKRDVMIDALRSELGDLASWGTPHGGFFLWVTLPDRIDADAMLARAVGNGVIYVAGEAFFVDRLPDAPQPHRDSGHNLIRMAFSLPTPDRIRTGVARLATTVREEMGATTPAAPSGRAAR